MAFYHEPRLWSVVLKSFAISQSVSGGQLLPLACSGGLEECNASLGVECLCPNFVSVNFLVPGINCDDIHDGADCIITPCSNPQFTGSQCAEGCVVQISCTANCNGVDFTASCPGFNDCSTEIAAATGC